MFVKQIVLSKACIVLNNRMKQKNNHDGKRSNVYTMAKLLSSCSIGSISFGTRIYHFEGTLWLRIKLSTHHYSFSIAICSKKEYHQDKTL